MLAIASFIMHFVGKPPVDFCVICLRSRLSRNVTLAQLLPMRTSSQIPSWAEVYRAEVVGAIWVQ